MVGCCTIVCIDPNVGGWAAFEDTTDPKANVFVGAAVEVTKFFPKLILPAIGLLAPNAAKEDVCFGSSSVEFVICFVASAGGADVPNTGVFFGLDAVPNVNAFAGSTVVTTGDEGVTVGLDG